MPRVLIVEDDPDMAGGLRDNIQFEGYEVLHADTGTEGLRVATEQKPDLILLDVMLPGMDGFEVCRHIRESGSTVPILMLTARGQEIDVVRGLELGADDYITKPFSLRELLARIKAALRRSGPASGMTTQLKIGPAEVDLARGRVRRGGQTHVLGHYEIEIMKMLVERAECNVSRNEILDAIWGESAFPTDRTVDNHIVSLRRKLEPDPKHPRHIVTVHSIGYKFVP
jgi:DNA-binding response OmpR family regulator